MDLSPVAAAISDEGIESAGKAIALGVGAGLGSIGAGIGIGIIFGKEIESAIVLARLSSASWIFGKATLLNTHIVKRKRTSVQIIRPRPGETRKLPPSSSPAALASGIKPAMWPKSSTRSA